MWWLHFGNGRVFAIARDFQFTCMNFPGFSFTLFVLMLAGFRVREILMLLCVLYVIQWTYNKASAAPRGHDHPVNSCTSLPVSVCSCQLVSGVKYLCV